eukprot:3076717-Amphidinium_carterae.2
MQWHGGKQKTEILTWRASVSRCYLAPYIVTWCGCLAAVGLNLAGHSRVPARRFHLASLLAWLRNANNQ